MASSPPPPPPPPPYLEKQPSLRREKIDDDIPLVGGNSSSRLSTTNDYSEFDSSYVEVTSADDNHDDDNDTSCYSMDTDSLATTSSRRSSSNGHRRRRNKSPELARKETIQVFRLRLLVFLVLLLAAIAVSVIVYYITQSAEVTQATSQYEASAEKVLETFLTIVNSKLRAVSSLGVASIAHQLDGDTATSRWPFVTLSSFQQRAATVRSESGALYLHINPIVSNTDRLEWETFVAQPENNYWIEEGLEYQDTIGTFDFLTTERRRRRREQEVHEREEEARQERFHALAELLLQRNETRYTQLRQENGLRRQRQQQQRNLQSSSTIKIWFRDANNDKQPEDGSMGLYLPVWQTSPVLQDGFAAVNENFLHYNYTLGPTKSFLRESVVISEFLSAPAGDMESSNPRTAFFALLLSTAAAEIVTYRGDPLSHVFFPIFDSFDKFRLPTAILVATIHWASYFQNVLPNTLQGIILVLSDSCGGVYTYNLQGEHVVPVAPGDLHDAQYNDMRRSASLESLTRIQDGSKWGVPIYQGDECHVELNVYPSTEFYAQYDSNTPLVITASVAIIFVFTACLFIVYDRLVERRQHLVMTKAEQTTAIVSSLFPENVRDRLMGQAAAAATDHGDATDAMDTSGKSGGLSARDGGGGGGAISSYYMGANHRLKSYLRGSQEDDKTLQPIADLFPDCTVLFADIAGFTAWSSTRDPAQVFILLQTVYQAFDQIANRRRVFKVETIGDSYVAVTGLPEAQVNHAVIMARFAGDCLAKMNLLTAELETTLGPDTADLRMRFGMHSGPVTAGVLRGERARFQLFGDTVNTASRMESTGIKDFIQVSEATHDLLVESGKSHWLRPRPDPVQAKGKGFLKTYWVNPNQSNKSAETTATRSVVSDSNHSNDFPAGSTLKQDRLVDWMVDMMAEYIQKLVAHRKHTAPPPDERSDEHRSKSDASSSFEPMLLPTGTPLEEVAEVIILPRYDPAVQAAVAEDPRRIDVSFGVLSELRSFISIIASTYHENPFHSFEHACHVTQATSKFIKRIVSPDIALVTDNSDADSGSKKSIGTGSTAASSNVTTTTTTRTTAADLASTLHDYTHGINSDPLTVLAILISALVHDVDHRGISNAQLIVEHKEMADSYSNKSIAEQNSLDIAWDLLMSDDFEELRGCLFTTPAELARFRQVLVNVVLATDIFDKELNDQRKSRWAKAFFVGEQQQLSEEETNDLRATIVIEHIIQASDVSHTMQHWHVYRKWNERLFREMHSAYRAGRMKSDPSIFWYNGELGFFDNYVIPLAKKLKDCNVFGVSSDECLNYAMQNRAEWAERGQEIVAEMMQDIFPDITELTESSDMLFASPPPEMARASSTKSPKLSRKRLLSSSKAGVLRETASVGRIVQA